MILITTPARLPTIPEDVIMQTSLLAVRDDSRARFTVHRLRHAQPPVGQIGRLRLACLIWQTLCRIL